MILNFLYAKLEYIVGSLCGISVITFDIPHLLLKIVVAIILGAAGALGASAWKKAESLIKNYKKKTSKKKY